ncbi:MAG: FAD-dependent oxidoreductase [Pseudomonadota bacterium]
MQINSSTQGVADVVIVGAGQAGFQLAVSLRQRQFEGSIALIGSEDDPSYHRPPLSKAALKEDFEPSTLWFRPDGFLGKQAIEERRGVAVVSVDRSAKQLHLSSGEDLRYGTLVLATGARPNRLPSSFGAAAQTALVLRTIEDAVALRKTLKQGLRLAIIGAGYIGLEVAASARLLGLDVHVVDREARSMSRTASPQVSTYFEALHRAHGVTFHLSQEIQSVRTESAKTVLALSSGETVMCDVLLAGVGVTPNTDLAAVCGLTVDDAIIVDAQGRTDDPSIFAIGDCARHAHVRYDQAVRFESVQSAIDQAKVVAAVIMGEKAAHHAVPWFWSDQFGTKLQTVGVLENPTTTFVRTDEDGRGLAVYHVKGEHLVAVEAANAPKDFVRARKLVASPEPFDHTQIDGLRPADDGG